MKKWKSKVRPVDEEVGGGEEKEEKEVEEEKEEEEKKEEEEEKRGKISPWLNKGRLVSEILPGYRPGPEINHHPEPNDPPSSTCHSETANHDSSVSIKEASQARRRHS
ncbi:hypothetical protein HZH68_001534 [Vespula germanica]|uniref:Uncharacterized protein n=1 Tax=Vespula germanica TaxID=30212 RepID=A0A834NVV6_VESGE|nr:hypothetical protein HZH68_001534 [Vespula germanica]